MAYMKTIWKDRDVEKPLTYTIQDNGDGTITLIPAEGTIVEIGTPIIAANLNNMENGIKDLDTGKLDKSGDTMTGDLNMADKKIVRPEIKDYAETAVVATGVSGNKTLDLETGNVFDITLSDDTTFVFSNPPASGKAGSFTLIIRQPSTLRTVTFPSSVKWNSDSVPGFVASKVAVLTFVTVNGGSRWYGFLAGNNFTA